MVADVFGETHEGYSAITGRRGGGRTSTVDAVAAVFLERTIDDGFRKGLERDIVHEFHKIEDVVVAGGCTMDAEVAHHFHQILHLLFTLHLICCGTAPSAPFKSTCGHLFL
jgi:DNA repair ATPase RecN